MITAAVRGGEKGWVEKGNFTVNWEKKAHETYVESFS